MDKIGSGKGKGMEAMNGKEFLLGFIDRELGLIDEMDELKVLHDLIMEKTRHKKPGSRMGLYGTRFCNQIMEDIINIMNNSGIPVEGNTVQKRIDLMHQRGVTSRQLRTRLARVKAI